MLAQKPAALADEIARYQNISTTSLSPLRLPCGSKSAKLGSITTPSHFQRIDDEHPWRHGCTCKQNTKTTRNMWGSAQNSTGVATISTSSFSAKCPTHASRSQFKLVVGYVLPRWLLSRAIVASFVCSEYSLVANLTPYYVIDRDSPVSELIQSWHKRCSFGRGSREQTTLLISRVRQLFVDGKASSVDVNTAGENYIGVSHSVTT